MMKMIKLIWVMLFSIAVAACGGGGSSASSAVSATATTTAQNLTVGTPMTSFSPLTPNGGATPYTYSYTGSLPAGLSFSSSTGAVTGTPTTVSTAVDLVFSVKDANNNFASTTSTVSFTVSAASGFVVQGGLTWMPVTSGDSWTNASVYCANTTINGQTGWRLPTVAELSALYSSGAMDGRGWTLGFTWSSELDGPFGGVHWLVDLSNGKLNGFLDSQTFGVTCVR